MSGPLQMYRGADQTRTACKENFFFVSLNSLAQLYEIVFKQRIYQKLLHMISRVNLEAHQNCRDHSPHKTPLLDGVGSKNM